MKKLFLATCGVLILGATTSCKKDWGCTCVDDSTGVTKDTYILTKKSKSVATGLCSDYEYGYGSTPTTCTLQE